MTFSSDIRRFVVKVQGRAPALLASIATKAHRSIVEGSAVTGSPGQPVDTGFLRNSWKLTFEPRYAEIRTNVAYAPAIEDGHGRFGPLTLRSTVGGFHSVKLTIAGANALQAEALKELGA